MSDFLERGVHSNLIIAVIFRRNQPLRGIRADYERRSRKQARLLEESWRSREFDWRLPGELREPVSHRPALERRLVDVGDGEFERQRLLRDLFGDAREQYMRGVQGVERTRQQHRERARRDHQLAIGLGSEAIELAGQKPVDDIDGGYFRVGKGFIPTQETAWRRRGDPARVGEPQNYRAGDNIFFGGAVTSALGHHARAGARPRNIARAAAS